MANATNKQPLNAQEWDILFHMLEDGNWTLGLRRIPPSSARIDVSQGRRRANNLQLRLHCPPGASPHLRWTTIKRGFGQEGSPRGHPSLAVGSYLLSPGRKNHDRPGRRSGRPWPLRSLTEPRHRRRVFVPPGLNITGSDKRRGTPVVAYQSGCRGYHQRTM